MIDEATLASAPLQVLGRLPDSSNNALLCSVPGDAGPVRVVYKPEAGEQPLWDFEPRTLSRREKAAAVLDELLGFNQVPVTAWREHGPAGSGTVQLWVEGDVDLAAFAPEGVPHGWVGVVDAETQDGPVVVAHRTDLPTARMIVFDAIANNADRKGGHLLPTPDGRIHGIDHGLTFHEDEKLRTVLWQWAGDPLRDEAIDVLARLRADLAGSLGEALSGLLTGKEVRRTQRRVQRLLSSAMHPNLPQDRRAIPWPPF